MIMVIIIINIVKYQLKNPIHLLYEIFYYEIIIFIDNVSI